MPTRATSIAIIATTMMLTPVATSAQQRCDSVLAVRNLEEIKLDKRADLATPALVNRENYEEAKHAAGAIIPGYFIGDYNDFAAKRNKLFTLNKYSRSDAESQSISRTVLPDNAVPSWLDCIKIQANSMELKVFIEDVTTRGATIAIQWTPPTGVGPLTRLSLNLGSYKGKVKLTPTTLLGTARLTLERAKTNEIRGIVQGYYNTATYSNKLFLPSLDDAYASILLPPIPTYLSDMRPYQVDAAPHGGLGLDRTY